MATSFSSSALGRSKLGDLLLTALASVRSRRTTKGSNARIPCRFMTLGVEGESFVVVGHPRGRPIKGKSFRRPRAAGPERRCPELSVRPRTYLGSSWARTSRRSSGSASRVRMSVSL